MCHQVSAEQTGIVTTLDLLTEVLLIQHRMLMKVRGVQEQRWESHVF